MKHYGLHIDPLKKPLQAEWSVTRNSLDFFGFNCRLDRWCVQRAGAFLFFYFIKMHIPDFDERTFGNRIRRHPGSGVIIVGKFQKVIDRHD